MLRGVALIFAVLTIAASQMGCVAIEPANISPVPGKYKTVLDISSIIDDGWEHLAVRGRTKFRIVATDGGLALRATGTAGGNASGLMRRIDVSTAKCRTIIWRWRVTQLQPSANLAAKSTDDVAAAIFVLFGDPGFLSNPDPVPTLRYVWTTKAHNVGDIIPNPYMPDFVRNVVVRTGAGPTMGWANQQRDIIADFAKAFSRPPPRNIHAIAVFTDNDQTKEAVESYYQSIALSCN